MIDSMNNLKTLSKSLIQNPGSIPYILLMFSTSTLLGFLMAGFPGSLVVTSFFVLASVSSDRLPLKFLIHFRGAREIGPHEAPTIYEIMGSLLLHAKLSSTPRLFWIPSASPNAFAMEVGDQKIIILSHGLLQALTAREIRGVLAHEIAHLKNEDPALMKLAHFSTFMTNILSSVGQLGALLTLPFVILGLIHINFFLVLALILAPWLNLMLQAGLSRHREREADRVGASLSKDPLGLAMALEKIHRWSYPWLLGILNRRFQSRPSNIFNTHPGIYERIAYLRAQARLIKEPILSPYWEHPFREKQYLLQPSIHPLLFRWINSVIEVR